MIVRITIFAAGSHGDIQPCVALGKGLRQAGYQVRLTAPENFGGFIKENDLDFFGLRGDVQKIMESDTGRRFMQTGGANPMKSITAIRKMLAPVVKVMIEDAYNACLDTEALVCLGVFGAFGHSIAESLQIPIINIEMLASWYFNAFSLFFQSPVRILVRLLIRIIRLIRSAHPMEVPSVFSRELAMP